MKACVIICISHWNAIYLWEMLFRWQKQVCTRRPTCLSKLYARSKVTSREEMKMNWIQDFQLPWEQSCQGHTRHRKRVTHNRRAHKIIRSNWNAPVRERGKEPIKSWPGDAHPSLNKRQFCNQPKIQREGKVSVNGLFKIWSLFNNNSNSLFKIWMDTSRC